MSGDGFVSLKELHEQSKEPRATSMLSEHRVTLLATRIIGLRGDGMPLIIH